MRDEVIYPFPNFNGCTVDIGELINNLNHHFTGHAINYPCWGYDPCNLVTVAVYDTSIVHWTVWLFSVLNLTNSYNLAKSTAPDILCLLFLTRIAAYHGSTRPKLLKHWCFILFWLCLEMLRLYIKISFRYARRQLIITVTLFTNFNECIFYNIF